MSSVNGHPIWKNDWIRSTDNGSILFINKKKTAEQKGVITFILKQIGKNILSGKSVMNISLPVDIFATFSNLERYVFSLTYSPTFLEPAANHKSSIDKLKQVAAFGLSNSLLYLDVEKPFNPILG